MMKNNNTNMVLVVFIILLLGTNIFTFTQWNSSKTEIREAESRIVELEEENRELKEVIAEYENELSNSLDNLTRSLKEGSEANSNITKDAIDLTGEAAKNLIGRLNDALNN